MRNKGAIARDCFPRRQTYVRKTHIAASTEIPDPGQHKTFFLSPSHPIQRPSFLSYELIPLTNPSSTTRSTYNIMLRSSRSPSPSSLPLNGLPINTKPTPRYSSRRSAISFFGTAALTGIVFHLLFLGLGGGDAVREVPVLKEWLPPKPSSVTVVQEACPDSLDPIRTHSATLPKPTYHPPTNAGTSTSKGKENAVAAGVEPEGSSDNTASIEELRKMVSQTQGFYGRDYSLGLGWNNVSLALRLLLGMCVSAGALR